MPSPSADHTTEDVRSAAQQREDRALMEESRGRAPAGGVIGVNGSWYDGGKFLPANPNRVKEAPPPRLAAGSKHEVGMLLFQKAPADWHLPLYAPVSAFLDHDHLRKTDRYRVNPILQESRAYRDSREHTDRYIEALNRGEEWRLAPDAPAGTVLLARGLEPDRAPSRLRAGVLQEVLPGQREPSPADWSTSLLNGVASHVDWRHYSQFGDLVLHPGAVRRLDPADRQEAKTLVARIRDGERWRRSTAAP